MTREEVAYKLIELYFTNTNTFRNYNISLGQLNDIYKDALNILKDEELQERINKAIEYIEKEWHWDGTGIDDLEEILRGED